MKAIESSNSDGTKLGYRYDEANRLAYVDDGSGTASGAALRTTSYAYNANGSLETMTAPNGVTHTYQYDSLNRLRSLTVANLSSQVLHSYNYSLRASGHRRQVVENSARTTAFEYDSLYRLTGETVSGDIHGNNGAVSYGLDKVGNRLSRSSSVPSVPSVVQSYNARDWLTTDSYDANGNTTLSSGVTSQDVYDFEDRLILRQKPDGTTINLSYDADGLLRQKTLLDAASAVVSTSSYLQDAVNPTGYAQIMEERVTTASGTTARIYAYGSDLISQSVVSGPSSVVLRYFAYDGLGSVRELTDETGTVTDAFDYDAFGVLVYRSGTTDNAYLYRGEQFDADLGMYSLRARFYNPDSGRFWNADTYEGSSSDPISLHRYLYANADPVMVNDPSGHMTIVELAAVGTVVGTITAIAVPRIEIAVGNAFAAAGFDPMDRYSLTSFGVIDQSDADAILSDLGIDKQSFTSNNLFVAASSKIIAEQSFNLATGGIFAVCAMTRVLFPSEPRLHMHHVIMKGEMTGWNSIARAYVKYSRSVLEYYGIALHGAENVISKVPNKGHSIEYAKEVARELWRLKRSGATREQICERLKWIASQFTDGLFP